MKRATVGEAQHHLSRILKYVDQGEVVLLTRRNHVVARIVPPDAIVPVLPQFLTRAQSIFGEPKGESVGQLIASDRTERA